jgi:hypothetical protein
MLQTADSARVVTVLKAKRMAHIVLFGFVLSMLCRHRDRTGAGVAAGRGSIFAVTRLRSTGGGGSNTPARGIG